MKIAQISPLFESVPPKLYGGTERVVSYLTEELVRMGHQVTLFASGDSRTSAKLVPITPRALRLDPQIQEPVYYHVMMIDRVMQSFEEFDLLHFHLDALHYPMIHKIADKTVSTLHGRLDSPDLKSFYRLFSDIPLVSISRAQRKPMPPVRWVGNVPHGLPRDLYKVQPKPSNYLAFLGRMSPEKRPDLAIAIAKKAGLPLKMAAKIGIGDKAYFEERVRPLLDDPLIEFIGEINDSDKQDFLGNSLALLFPINWPEPFGLTMIEAMACGTPTIAFNHGSVPDVLEDGLSGFIVNTVDEAVEALAKLPSLSRTRIRNCFEQRFTATLMARNYIAVYEDLLATEPRRKQA